jgi:hypothetical protein
VAAHEEPTEDDPSNTVLPVTGDEVAVLEIDLSC